MFCAGVAASLIETYPTLERQAKKFNCSTAFSLNTDAKALADMIRLNLQDGLDLSQALDNGSHSSYSLYGDNQG